MRSHSAQAVRHGATQEEIDALDDHERGPFDEAEKAAFAWAEALTRGNGHVDDGCFARLAASWGEGEMVEITEMAALFNYFNRVANSLQIHPTQPGEGL